MRRLANGVLAATLLIAASVGAPPPTAAANGDTPQPKVVLVVGATHGTTPTYRAWMNEVYTAARRYTTNVVKVYSPNATWSAIKNAAQGANILVYMGHGNGFPSPYRSSLYPQSENGIGANATAGAGDYNTKYYGEYYVARDIRLAPNAVVLLSHLCYASGNSEPGKTDPTLSQAKQRMDNYAAGFIAAGARAVIADGHMDPAWYIDQLFTTRKSVDAIFRSHPSAAGSVYSFASARSPGYTALYDPDKDSPLKGFYRSMVSVPGLYADDVTGSGAAPTDEVPADFVVPGAAEVTADGGGLYADSELTPDPGSGAAPKTLAAATRVRVLAEAATAGAERVLHVKELGGDADGWMRAADLAPRDSLGPRIGRFAVAPGVLSPIISGSRATIAAAATEVVTWTVSVTDAAGAVITSATSSGRDLLTSWDGRRNGEAMPDGTYSISVTARDGWGNDPARASGKARVDGTRPELTVVRPEAAGPLTFSPNNDGSSETTAVPWLLSEAASVRLVIRNGAGTPILSRTIAGAAGKGSFSWNGRSSAGAIVPDGDYAVELTPVDAAGNSGDAASAPTRVYTALRAVAITRPVFYPNDGDALATSIALPFALDKPATVSWRILDAKGATVLTIKDGEALAKGAYSFTWKGVDATGTQLPAGIYRSAVTATDGTAVTRVYAPVTIAAFTIAASDATPARRQQVTFTVTSAEPLTANPTLRITEPGRKSVTYRTTKVGTRTYRVTLRLVGSRTGSLVVRVAGRDTGGGSNATRVVYPIH